MIQRVSCRPRKTLKKDDSLANITLIQLTAEQKVDQRIGICKNFPGGDLGHHRIARRLVRAEPVPLDLVRDRVAEHAEQGKHDAGALIVPSQRRHRSHRLDAHN